MQRFAGKVALVTGASTGIGLETIKRLRAEGGTVFAAHRRGVLDLEGVPSIALDVTNDENWVRAISEVVSTAGRLDILINNAGVRESGSVEETTLEQWHRLIDTVKAPNAAEYVERLSGGNQQKVSLAKWLLSENLRLLILDHPTRGLDPGAKADLFEAIRDLSDHGISIVFVSETLEETLGMADTVVVMRDGKVSATFPNLYKEKPKPEKIVEAMV